MNYKHYYKKNENNEVIDTFPSWQKEKFDGDEIFYLESNNRHFVLNLINADTGQYKYIVDNGEIREKTNEELYTPDVQDELFNKQVVSAIKSTDSDTIRIIEDIINVLIAKNTIKFDDMPAEAQSRLTDRKTLRESLK